MTVDVRVGFIGGGNMARAICLGMIRKGIITADKILVSAPSEQTRHDWDTYSVKTTHSNSEVVRESDIIFLAFKPYQLESALHPMRSEIPEKTKSKLFISVLAGVSCNTLYKVIKNNVQDNPRLIRVMPNIPAMVFEGCTVIALDSSALPNDADLVQKIFSSLGKCDIVPESTIASVTGLTGSGPAYVFLIIEALSDGAVKQGLPRNLATKFAAQTVLGAAKMVLETNKHPSELKDEVCSAGGTTIHGVHALEKGGLRAALMDAVEAAARRGFEIGKSSEK